MARKKAGEYQMRLMFASLLSQLGRMSEVMWNAMTAVEQDKAIQEAARAADMNPRTVQLRNYAALRHKGLNAGFPPALMASSIAFAVGYISYTTHEANVMSFQAKTAANAAK